MNYLLSLLFSVVIYNVINIMFYKDLLRRFGFFKLSRKDFYECGFRPQLQKPIKLSIQFLMICIFFLLYDIELLFIFPFVSGISFFGFFDFFIFWLFILFFIISMLIDYDRHVLFWQY
jgi:NADH:ubiquinone oxidoreductase subunit 3 (subunit A)